MTALSRLPAPPPRRGGADHIQKSLRAKPGVTNDRPRAYSTSPASGSIGSSKSTGCGPDPGHLARIRNRAGWSGRGSGRRRIQWIPMAPEVMIRHRLADLGSSALRLRHPACLSFSWDHDPLVDRKLGGQHDPLRIELRPGFATSPPSSARSGLDAALRPRSPSPRTSRCGASSQPVVRRGRSRLQRPLRERGRVSGWAVAGVQPG